MVLTTVKAKAGWLFSILLVCTLAVSGQQKPVAPSLTPLQSPDNGMQSEIEQLDNYVKTHKAAVEQLQKFTDEYTARNDAHRTTGSMPDTTCVITIPVVFHVFHPDGSAGVPLSQINFAMNDLNVNYAGADVDFTTVNPAFAAVKSYTKFRWKLAQVDPKGNPTTGVEYYQDKQSGFGNGTGYDREIRTCAWDNLKYFNIYVMNDLYCNNVTNNSGVCWYPDISMSDSETSREVYNYVYLGSGGSSYGYLEFNETFSHEAGHWLNLIHTFDGLSCSGPGDYVVDTPPTDSAAAGCNAIRCGGLINGENYMDYNNTCLKNFTIGQNTRMEAASLDPSRFPIWQYDNLVATGLLSPTTTNPCVTATKFFAFSKTTLTEDDVNDGSIETPPVVIYACSGVQFAKSGATLVAGTDYTLVNVPAGLAATIVTAADGLSATLTLSGKATSHAASNSIANMTLTFNNAAITGGGASTITNYTKTFLVNFKDPWSYSCDAPNMTTTAVSTWNAVETIGPIPRFYGLLYSAGSYLLENYGRAIITTGSTSDNVMFLPAGTNVGPASTWRAGGSEGVLYSTSYSSLDNSTGYVGFRMEAALNTYYYGWMKISVSSATGVTLLEYQYCNKPNTAVVTGSVCGVPLSIQEQQEQNIVVYPNPSAGEIHIGNMSTDNHIVVYDIAGRTLINTTTPDRNVNMDLRSHGLTDGVYIIKITSGDQTTVKRVVLTQ